MSFSSHPGFWLMIAGVVVAVIGLILKFLGVAKKADHWIIIFGGILFVAGLIWAVV